MMRLLRTAFVSFIANGKLYRSATDATGKFSIVFSNCTNETSEALTGYDVPNLQEGQSTNVLITGNSVDAGVLRACGTTINEFFTFNVNNAGETRLIPPVDSFYTYVSGTSTIIQAYKRDYSRGLSIEFAGKRNTVGQMRLIHVSYFGVPANSKVNITTFGNYYRR
jgi:hypothetical protein